MKIRFACPVCEHSSELAWTGASQWDCADCDLLLQIPPAVPAANLDTCVICGNREFFKKKDFPHGLGIGILAAACLLFILAHGLYWKWTAWTILIASAVFDGLLYLVVNDALVCYRCAASYHGAKAGPHHYPFEIGIAERYRQERIRRKQLQGTHKSS